MAQFVLSCFLNITNLRPHIQLKGIERLTHPDPERASLCRNRTTDAVTPHKRDANGDHLKGTLSCYRDESHARSWGVSRCEMRK